MQFAVHGPFDMPRTEAGYIPKDPSLKREFWKKVDEKVEGLSDACGCYVYSIRTSGGELPWYVGKAEKQTFASECFQPHKLVTYNEVLQLYDRAVPRLYFIAKVTFKTEAFSAPSQNGRPAVAELEDLLIGIAYTRNPKLMNVQGTGFLANAVVPGVINTPQGNPGNSASALKSVLGL